MTQNGKSALKPLVLAGGAAALSAIAGDPHLAFLAPLFTFLAGVNGNVFASEAERRHASAHEAANYLHNLQVAGHVGRVASAVIAQFAGSADAPVRGQLEALAQTLPDFWVELHSADAVGTEPLDGQQFIQHIANVLAKADADPALPAEQWLPVLAAAANTLPETNRPSEAILLYAARYLAQHLGEKLAVALTSSDADSQRVFRKVLLRFLGQLLLDQQKFYTEYRLDAAEMRDAISQWREAACKAASEGPADADSTRLLEILSKANEILAKLEGVEQGVSAANQKLDRIEAAIAFPRPMGPALFQLPPCPEGFVGRVVDLEKLRGVNLARGAVLTALRGMGGIGKTALAVVLAHEWAPAFPDAQIFLNGYGTRKDPPPPTASDLLIEIISAFRPENANNLPDDIESLKKVYHGLLNGRKTIIFLDNAADPEICAQTVHLIPPAGNALIVTTRFNIVLGRSAAYHVGKLVDAEAVALLREYHPALGDADAAEIVRLCSGLPLALRLAGAYLALDAVERGGTPGVAGYRRALGGGRLKHLDVSAAGAGEITISETLRLSEGQLPPEERDAWRRLAIFTASFDAPAAQAVAGAAEEMLGRFVRRSILEREGGDRYRLHDLAGDYARTQLDERLLAELHLVHAKHYAKAAVEANKLYQSKGKAALGLAMFDQMQIEAAMDWLVALVGCDVPGANSQAAETPNVEAVKIVLYFLTNALGQIGHMRFHPRKLRHWFDAQLATARASGDRKSERDALCNLGNIYSFFGDTGKAIELYNESLRLFRQEGDHEWERTVLQNLASAQALSGDIPKAIELHEAILAITREARDSIGEAFALIGIGVCHLDLGEARKAADFNESALVIAREIGDRRLESSALGNLGSAYAQLGDVRKAIEFSEEGLLAAQEAGDPRMEGTIWDILGSAHADLGDIRRAVECHQQALVVSREVGARRTEEAALYHLGNVYEKMGDKSKAIEFHEQALAVAREIADPRMESNTLDSLGDSYAALDNTRKAIEYFSQALVVARRIGNRRKEATALRNLGNANAKIGQQRDAIGFHEQALVAACEIGDRQVETSALENVGNAYGAIGEWRKAIEFFERQLVVAREIGNRAAEANALGYIGLANWNLGEKRRFIEFYELQLIIARELGQRPEEAGILENLGTAHEALGEESKAIECYEESLAIKNEIPDRFGKLSLLDKLALAYWKLGEMNKVIEFNKQIVVISREIGNQALENVAIGRLGNAYCALGRTREGIEHYKQKLVMARHIADRREEGNALGDLCPAYASLGLASKALDFCEQALIIRREIGDRRGEGCDLSNSALVYDSLGNRREALIREEAALSIFEEIKDPNATRAHSTLARWKGLPPYNRPLAPDELAEHANIDVMREATAKIERKHTIPEGSNVFDEADKRLEIFMGRMLPTQNVKQKEAPIEEDAATEIERISDVGKAMAEMMDFLRENAGDKSIEPIARVAEYLMELKILGVPTGKAEAAEFSKLFLGVARARAIAHKENANARRDFAQKLLSSGDDPERGAEFLQELYDLGKANPEDPIVREICAWALHVESNKAAVDGDKALYKLKLDELRNLSIEHPEDARVRVPLAKSLNTASTWAIQRRDMDQRDASLTELRALSAADPDNRDVRFALVDALFKAGAAARLNGMPEDGFFDELFLMVRAHPDDGELMEFFNARFKSRTGPVDGRSDASGQEGRKLGTD